MQATHAPPMAVQITGPRDAIEKALQRGLLPEARFHAIHGLEWIEVGQITDRLEAEMMSSGCIVHHRYDG